MSMLRYSSTVHLRAISIFDRTMLIKAFSSNIVLPLSSIINRTTQASSLACSKSYTGRVALTWQTTQMNTQALTILQSSHIHTCRITLKDEEPTTEVALVHSVFKNEGEFHHVSDQTLEKIQDVLDETLLDEDGVECNLASGVLTISFGRHGTWVINKQTPNRQLWWSSPKSGPRRYEYVMPAGTWAFTRRSGGVEGIRSDAIPSDAQVDQKDTLFHLLSHEIEELFHIKVDFN